MTLNTSLLGRFNADNLLAALGVLLSLEIPLESAAARLARTRPVAGRMERFTQPGRATVVVDYAHTPDALEHALESLAEHCRGSLWCVFGCGGERDRGKRPRMGAVAEGHARHVILTDDNPRGEQSLAIIRDIRRGMRDADAVTVIPVRAEAIAHAVGQAAAEDIVLVAGKGHEDYQERDGVRVPYSDRDTVRHLLAGRGR